MMIWVTFENLRSYAISPDSENSAAWKFASIFDFDDESGFWQSVAMLGIRQGGQRRDINTLVASSEKGTIDRKKKTAGRVCGGEENPKSQYPAGTNLTADER